ncbi:MAG: sulfatase [Armatimonadetes bacterium Cent15-Ar3]|nr:MAG: sulfatase [Armatimonadetes bacterium Cent15-Ar3]
MISLFLAAGVLTAPIRPNIIILLIDDLGWKDFGVLGSSVYKTPNIDRFAAEGTRFSQSYAAASVCSPTRASLFSGQYPARLGITDWLPGADIRTQKLVSPQMPEHLDRKLVTLPEALRNAGYTTWNVGKWHLGADPYGPTANGFDVNIAGNETGQPTSYFYPYGNEGNDYNRVRPLSGGRPGEYLTDRLTDEAMGLIDRKDGRPFFLQLSHYTVHMPLEAKASDFAKYESLVGKDFAKRRATYAAMVDNLDQNVGKLMSHLRDRGLDNDTLVFITSDNGGLHDVTDNKPLRLGKGYLYEGGIRTPLIARWPGRVPSGKVSVSPVSTIDYYPTLLETVGLAPVRSQLQDGVSFATQLLGKARTTKERTLYWHYPHYHTVQRPPASAIRKGNLKLVHWYETDKDEVYDLEKDPGETRDLSEENPSLRMSLRNDLDRWLIKVGAKFATANPKFRTEKTAQIPRVSDGDCSCRLSIYRDQIIE